MGICVSRLRIYLIGQNNASSFATSCQCELAFCRCSWVYYSQSRWFASSSFAFFLGGGGMRRGLSWLTLLWQATIWRLSGGRSYFRLPWKIYFPTNPDNRESAVHERCDYYTIYVYWLVLIIIILITITCTSSVAAQRLLFLEASNTQSLACIHSLH